MKQETEDDRLVAEIASRLLASRLPSISPVEMSARVDIYVSLAREIVLETKMQRLAHHHGIKRKPAA